MNELKTDVVANTTTNFIVMAMSTRNKRWRFTWAASTPPTETPNKENPAIFLFPFNPEPDFVSSNDLTCDLTFFLTHNLNSVFYSRHRKERCEGALLIV